MSTTIATNAAGLPLLLAVAKHRGIPLPFQASVGEHDVSLQLHTTDGLEAIYQWAELLDAEVTHKDPHEYAGRWSLHHRAEGRHFDLDVTVLLVQFGVMAEPESYECRTCGARFGTTGGFVADGDDNGHFEAEVARHQDGICFGAAGVA